MWKIVLPFHPPGGKARSMRLATLLPLLLALAAHADDAGFSPIFDGKSLDGWRGQDAAFWSVEDGAITGTITAERPAPSNQYLVWQGGLVEDFELKIEFRLTGSATPETNSGFQFRSRRLPNGDVGGYQVDINAGQPPRAALYDEFGRHFLAREGERSVFDAEGKKTVEKFDLEPGARDFKLDEWHEYHLTAVGPKMTLRVNGRLISEVTDNDADSAEARGVLALQLHTGPPMKIQFRNVRLKRSPSKATPRDVLMAEAALDWQPGERADAHQPMLKAVGEITPGIVVEGARVARMKNAYFDAAVEFNSPKAWNTTGDALTVLLRARVPDGNWTTALFAKRGGHDVCHFNLFSVDLPETPGPDIGFEIHTDRGFYMVGFPVSKIDARAWHDLAARYDGQRLQLLCDGAVMAEKPAFGALTANQEPVLLGAETDNGKPVRFFTGEMAEAALWTRALDDAELATVLRREAIVALPKPWRSPVQFRPAAGRLADTIPFFHDGEYHIFYLLAEMGKVPWEHLVSRDLVHWRELPRALTSDGAPDSTDGENMFTGSVVERDGTWHIFYTGDNPRHPLHTEHICHATSRDGLAWTKHPEHTFTADGTHYDASRADDFRDPFVFWNEDDKQWWMLLCARAAGDRRPVTGVATSRDLVTWEQQPPLCDGYRATPECPDIFRIGATWYLIVSPSENVTTYRSAPALRGPWSPAPGTPIDTPILYAAKRMFDGQRHILTGWQRDRGGDADSGGFQWGGTQSIPREVFEVAPGELGFRPVEEIRAAFSQTVFSSEKEIALGGGVGASSGARFTVPDHYRLDCRVALDGAESFTVSFREQAGSGYRLTIFPKRGEIALTGPAGVDFRRACALDPAQPVRIEAYVLGTLIECFVNDRHAFTTRAYTHPAGGALSFGVDAGRATVRGLRVQTAQ